MFLREPANDITIDLIGSGESAMGAAKFRAIVKQRPAVLKIKFRWVWRILRESTRSTLGLHELACKCLPLSAQCS
jgi:hypothetical protein